MRLTYLGDSKTTSPNWTNLLEAGLRSIHNFESVAESPTRLATAGWKVADLDSALTAWLAAAGGSAPHYVILNVGVNDANGGTSQASFEASFASVLNKVHTKWPFALVAVNLVWRRNFDAVCDAIDNTWIPNAMAGKPWAEVWLDERNILKGSDNGATNTSDGVHLNSSGDMAWASGLQAIIESKL